MSATLAIPPVRILPEELANKIAAGEVVERPASVVKELVENALDARATRVVVRLVAAGRRTIEVQDNGHGMSEQDALLAIERHATSKIRKAEDLDNIRTMGFRGEALASIAAVSHFEMVTRRAKDNDAVRIRVDGGILRDVGRVAAPVGTRVTVNRLYFNTPVRAKFLKGITTELSHAADIAQRHALAQEGVGFQLLHNEKFLLDLPENATLRERVALIWGLNFVRDMLEFSGEAAGFRFKGMLGLPDLTRSSRSHQFFFLNRRPVNNHSLQYGFEDGYHGLVGIGRKPVGIILVETHPRLVDVNIHPTKREIRFRDERAVRDALRDVVRQRLTEIRPRSPRPVAWPRPEPVELVSAATMAAPASPTPAAPLDTKTAARGDRPVGQMPKAAPAVKPATPARPLQTELAGTAGHEREKEDSGQPLPMYEPVDRLDNAPIQLFDTYLVVPQDDRLLIIDQHALHERLTYDNLRADLEDNRYAAQQLAVPVLLDVPPSHVKLLESNIKLFAKLGIEIEPFGGNTFQITAVCHLYDDSKMADAVYRVVDEIAQGDLFNEKDFVSDLLRLTVESCRGAVKAGDRLSTDERRHLLEGFQRLRPPYTCPHGRPIITEITQHQMEKSFHRIK
ncbi:MAG: DNA mismatch repair endonuclease MutL [Candidatus Hydrogenedentes bacterium]|nr:DNA mismatch repair endonuclease MutL [Candidatus Hydrogenedentota bacterium]